jgi:hypothetical protein
VGVVWGFLLVPGVELRHYGPGSAAAALALLGVVAASEDPAPRWSPWAAGLGLLLLVHLQAQGWLLVAAVGLAALVRRRKPLILAVVLAVLGGAPQGADSVGKFLHFRQERARPALPLKRLLGPAVQLTAGFRVANVTQEQLRADKPALAWLGVVALALGVAGLGLLRLYSRGPVLLLAWVLVAFAGGMVALAPGGYKARYLALLGPPGVALVVAGLAASPAPRLGLMALLAANAWSSWVVAQLPVNPVHREDSRAGVRWLAEAPEGARAVALVFGAEALLEVERRREGGEALAPLALAACLVNDPGDVAQVAAEGAPPSVRIIASRQNYLDPAVVRELELAMEQAGYQVTARERFGDHLPAWEFHRRGDSS